MGEPAPRGIVAPNFRTPRLIGIFSVVFASELLIVGLCMGGYVAILPLFARMMDASQQQMTTLAESAKRAELASLADQEKAAKTEKEKIELAYRRREVEARSGSPMEGMLEVNKASMGDPALIRFSWVDVLSAMALNVLMLASGIGLLHWRPWARSLGLWVAGLKIVRLVLLYGVFIIVVVPPYSQRLGKAYMAMMSVAQPMGGATPPAFANGDFFAKVYTVMFSAYGLGMMSVGAIYPAIVLWHLTRPAVKSACSGLLRTPKEPNQP